MDLFAAYIPSLSPGMHSALDFRRKRSPCRPKWNLWQQPILTIDPIAASKKRIAIDASVDQSQGCLINVQPASFTPCRQHVPSCAMHSKCYSHGYSFVYHHIPIHPVSQWSLGPAFGVKTTPTPFCCRKSISWLDSGIYVYTTMLFILQFQTQWYLKTTSIQN